MTDRRDFLNFYLVLFSPSGSLLHRKSFCLVHIHGYDSCHNTRSRQVNTSHTKSLHRVPVKTNVWLIFNLRLFRDDCLPMCALFIYLSIFFFKKGKCSFTLTRFKCSCKWELLISTAVFFSCQPLSCFMKEICCYATV